jgi:hypothetical protein
MRYGSHVNRNKRKCVLICTTLDVRWRWADRTRSAEPHVPRTAVRRPAGWASQEHMILGQLTEGEGNWLRRKPDVSCHRFSLLPAVGTAGDKGANRTNRAVGLTAYQGGWSAKPTLLASSPGVCLDDAFISSRNVPVLCASTFSKLVLTALIERIVFQLVPDISQYPSFSGSLHVIDRVLHIL